MFDFLFIINFYVKWASCDGIRVQFSDYINC
jgi:hypothetical protein